MILLPAIDLIDGQVVRLRKGKYNEKSVYYKNPLEMAKKIEKFNLKNLHIIDLDRALGKKDNEQIIFQIRENTRLNIQVGGGLRDEKIIKKYLDKGIDKVILGTRAIRDPLWAKKIIEKYQSRIIISLDSLGEKLKLEGREKDSGKDIFSFIKENPYIKNLIYTDISKDGMLEGANIEMLKKIREIYKGNLTAAAGISCIEDLENLQKIQVDGAIIGKALYEGKISLKEMSKWEKK